MLLSMVKVQIIGTKRCQDTAVELLCRLGMVQIDEWSERRSLSEQRMTLSDEAIQMRQRLIYASTRVDTVLAAFPPHDCPISEEYEGFYSQPLTWLLEAVEADLADVGPQAQYLVRRRDQIEEQLASFARYETTLKQLLPLVPALVDLEHFAMATVWLERRYQVALEIITRQLEELTDGQCEVISREVDQDVQAVVLVFPKTHTRAVNELLGRENIAQVRLPPELAGQPLQQAMASMHQRLEAIPLELADIDARHKRLAEEWVPRLRAWQALLADQLAEIDVLTRFGQTDYTFIIEGWMPERNVAELQATLRREAGEEVVVTRLPLSAEDKERAPVVFDNPFFVKPFEPLVQLLALPRYGALDPTPLMSLFLPLFFGMILGDIAYGAVLLVLMIYLRHRFAARPTMRRLAEVLIIGSVWGIVFGFIYGEFLGSLGEKFGLHPLWFNRGPENLINLFLLTVGVGAGHVVLGLCLGLVGALRRHSAHAALEKAATLVSLAGLFLLVAVIAQYLPAFLFTPAMALLIVGLAILIYTLGGIGVLLGPLELLGTVGNILSYLRIAAIGLSSVYLAEVASSLYDSMHGNVLLGVIVAALFHALNIALGAFSPTVHSLRLHYVEFFGRFYESGGQAFRPFRRSIAGHTPLHMPGERRTA